MSDDTSYNIGTDILLEWGQVFLQPETFPEFLSEIEEEALSLDASLETYLEEGTARIAGEAASAREILEAPDIIGLTPDDEKWYEAEAAFYALDLTVYLSEALAHTVRKKNVLLADTLLAELDKQTDLTADFLHDDAFSPLRLIPFNEIRKNMLESIGEKHRYLFPWYELMSEEDPGILELLIAHYHNLGSAAKLPESLRGNPSFYLAELSRDAELGGYVRTENAISFSLDRTFSQHWAFRLWNAARSAGYGRLLPEKAEIMGIESVSRAIFERKPRSESEKIIRDITGACFAPEIEEDRRIQMLIDSQDKVRELKSEKKDALSFQCAEQLKALDAGEINADIAAESLLDFWFDRMEAAVKDLSVAELKDKVSSSIKETASSVKEQVTDIIESLCNPFVEWKLAPGFMKDAREPEEEPKKIKGFVKTCGYREDDMVILLDESDENSPEIKTVIQNIKGSKRLYSQVLVELSESAWRVYEEVPDIKTFPVKIEDADHERFLLILDSQGKRMLKKSVEAMMNAIFRKLDPSKKISSKTIVILIEIT